MTDQLDHMPYVRDPELCEICGQRQWPESFPLMRVELEPASGGTPSDPNYRAARVVFACSRHAEQGPARWPRGETLEGTSRKRPQLETLFGLDPASPYDEGRAA